MLHETLPFAALSRADDVPTHVRVVGSLVVLINVAGQHAMTLADTVAIH